MSSESSNIAIIPARGGSIRIKRKNLLSFFGVPFVARAIETAKRSQLFEKILISTDDEEIHDVGIAWGAVSQGLRPSDLADNFTSTADVIRYEISRYIEANPGIEKKNTNVYCIYPCTPFLTPCQLIHAFEILTTKPDSFVVSCLPFETPIERSIVINEDGLARLYNAEAIEERSQDFKNPRYYDAGQFYAASSQSWFDRISPLSGSFSPLFLKKFSAIDINDEEDLEFARVLFSNSNRYRS